MELLEWQSEAFVKPPFYVYPGQVSQPDREFAVVSCCDNFTLSDWALVNSWCLLCWDKGWCDDGRKVCIYGCSSGNIYSESC